MKMLIDVLSLRQMESKLNELKYPVPVKGWQTAKMFFESIRDSINYYIERCLELRKSNDELMAKNDELMAKNDELEKENKELRSHLKQAKVKLEVSNEFSIQYENEILRDKLRLLETKIELLERKVK